MGAGEASLEASKRLGSHISPVKFNFKDSPQVSQLKVLISTMVNHDPKERPNIDEVLQRVTEITGDYLCAYLYQNIPLCNGGLQWAILDVMIPMLVFN